MAKTNEEYKWQEVSTTIPTGISVTKSNTIGTYATSWNKTGSSLSLLTPLYSSVEEVRNPYLVKFGGDVYITCDDPKDFHNPVPFGAHVELTSYDGKRKIACLAEEYFTHAKVICSLGQVIDSIAETHIDKK